MRIASALAGLSMVALGALALTLPACGKQGEGAYCATTNGSDDCNDGLQCSDQSICCPPNPANATTAACRGGGATTIDAGAVETASTDSAGEASVDSATDATTSEVATDAGDASTSEAAVDASDGGSPDATDATDGASDTASSG
jgi:hypothetical protein